MTAIEAMQYCLVFIYEVPADGDVFSQAAHDVNGELHWFAWSVAHGRTATPRPCSSCPHPFAAELEPYRE